MHTSANVVIASRLMFHTSVRLSAVCVHLDEYRAVQLYRRLISRRISGITIERRRRLTKFITWSPLYSPFNVCPWSFAALGYLHAKCIPLRFAQSSICAEPIYICISPALFVVVIATGKLLNLVCLDFAQKLLCGILPAGWHHDAIPLYHRGTTQTWCPNLIQQQKIGAKIVKFLSQEKDCDNIWFLAMFDFQL